MSRRQTRRAGTRLRLGDGMIITNPGINEINKVVYNGASPPIVLIDLTTDTITPETVLAGYQGHGANGKIFTGTYEPTSGSIDITNLCPQIICADNHLRDVVEMDGAAYVRIGFYELAARSKTFSITLTETTKIDKLVAIGPGGYGAGATQYGAGAGGFCGEHEEQNSIVLPAGNYTVFCGYDTDTVLTDVESGEIFTYAKAGYSPSAGEGSEGSSISGLPGDDGYMLDLQPSRFNFGVNNNINYTGAGIGAGGSGEGNASEEIAVVSIMRRGLGGGVFFYVKL